MLEKNLVYEINDYLESNGIRYSNELRMGIGIPDISLNIGANYRLKPIEDYYAISILTFIEERQIVSFNDIKNEFLITIERVKQYVLELVNLSLVIVKKNLVKVLKSIFSTKLGTVISIEAKLKDWKGACLQAQRYLNFSDYAYVAMPANYIKNVDKDLFVRHGIGLLSVSGKIIEEVIPARKSNQCQFIQKYLITSKIIERYTNVKKKHLRKNIFSNYTYC